ncbi:hypothetical protein F0U60_49350 [Archangium minus]|uniref:Lipoprotein n=1 Tax=Archangium minus TaxID=83450 RepID=A0ABY9X7A5_9BACT|nr:hypothetical protein F0U60_49350 [Archangium minus]
MTPRKLMFVTTIALSSCVRKPEQFSTPAGRDRSIIFPLSVGEGLVEVEAQKATYDLDGEVMKALMVAANDYIPPGIRNPPCWARHEALTYRFTRREDIIFVYIGENFEYCDRKLRPIHYGAKYAISKDGRILRRVIDGFDEDDHVWSLKTPDGGTVTVVTESADSPDLEDLDKPDSGILKITTDPVNMPDVMVIEPLQDSKPIREGNGIVPGMSMLPFEGSAGPVEAEPGVIPFVTMLPPDSGYTWEYRDGGLVAVPLESAPALDGGTPDAG